MITVWRIFIAGFRNFLRNLWLSTAATAVMTVTLTIILVSFISNLALTATIRGVVNKIDVSIYLRDDLTPDQLKSLQARLASTTNVDSVRYISKTEALDTYKKQNAGNAQLLAAISATDNPLPQSLQIKAKDPNKLDPIVAAIKQPDIQKTLSPDDPPSYSGNRKAVIDKIIKTSNFFKTFGLAASIMFVTISILIIFNTIRMAIFTRRDEIEIMKLVGATNWFIRGPFIFEAALYGIIAAVVSLILVYGIVVNGAPKLGSYIDVVSALSLFKRLPLVIFAGELLLGVFIGTLSSVLAMTRYMKL